MPSQLETLYRLQKGDLQRAGAVLADAFRQDPVWTKVFEGAATGDREMGAWYESAVRYCHKYGQAYATSKHLEGVAAWVSGDLADMTAWRMLRAGSISTGMRMGMAVARRAQRMRPVFDQLEADRKANMKGRGYTYVMIVGVASAFQGRGHGGKLLRALIEESQRERVPIYLETETQENVVFYQGLGFRLIRQILLPIISLPMWEMVREPGP